MNIKLHSNIFFDSMIIIFDAALVYAANLIFYLFLSIFYTAPVNYLVIVLEIFCVLFIFYTYDFYTKLIRRKYEIMLSIAITVLVTTITILISGALFPRYFHVVSRIYYLIVPILMFSLIFLWKIVLLRIIKNVEGASKLLVIESKDVEDSLARKIKYSYLELYEAWYTQIDVNNDDEIKNIINEFDKYSSIFISPDIPENVVGTLISKAVSKRKEIYILPDLYNISIMKNETVQFEDTPALRIKQFGLSKMQNILKRIMDIFVSTVGIVITSPIMLIVAIAIKMDSDGPVIYKQERLTYMQKSFNVLKFRTMYDNAEKNTGAVFAMDNDPRITKVGKVLRSLRIDELPQFFNIFIGDMTIVGPRPERAVFVKEFILEIPDYDKRFFVKAGLTGFAQVYGRYDTTPENKVLYDLLYIKQYSMFLDIKLILLTIKTVFVKESSEGFGARPDYSKVKEKKQVTI